MSNPALDIRTMTSGDVALGMRLKAAAGWNQTEATWRRFLSISPGGCFIGEVDGTGVATVVAMRFGPVAWIAMMLVDPAWRRQGIGRAMMAHALAWCEAEGATTIRLDATPLGRTVYEPLGFRPAYELVRYAGIVSGQGRGDGTEVTRPADSAIVAGLDRALGGVDRSSMIEAMWREDAGAFRVVDGRGYATSYPGTDAVQIGPIMAGDAAAGLALLDHTLSRHAGERVYIDIPLCNEPAVRAAAARGLSKQRDLLRMERGEALGDDPMRIFASSGPEKG